MIISRKVREVRKVRCGGATRDHENRLRDGPAAPVRVGRGGGREAAPPAAAPSPRDSSSPIARRTRKPRCAGTRNGLRPTRNRVGWRYRAEFGKLVRRLALRGPGREAAALKRASRVGIPRSEASPRHTRLGIRLRRMGNFWKFPSFVHFGLPPFAHRFPIFPRFGTVAPPPHSLC